MVRTRAVRLATATALVGSALAGAGLAMTPAASATLLPAVSKAHPHIVANPDNLMVNTVTDLTGTGFPPDKKLAVSECSVTTWTAGQQPCATGNVVNVRTTAQGGFQAPLTAVVCPKVNDGFREVCYVGVVRISGLDSLRLVGAAKLIVTGP